MSRFRDSDGQSGKMPKNEMFAERGRRRFLGLLSKPAINDLDILHQHNPLRFDFTLKRLLNWLGHSFSPAVFNTRRLFAVSHA